MIFTQIFKFLDQQDHVIFIYFSRFRFFFYLVITANFSEEGNKWGKNYHATPWFQHKFLHSI